MTEWNTHELIAADPPSLKLRRGFITKDINRW
jgi:hypothetical protein